MQQPETIAKWKFIIR